MNGKILLNYVVALAGYISCRACAGISLFSTCRNIYYIMFDDISYIVSCGVLVLINTFLRTQLLEH